MAHQSTPNWQPISFLPNLAEMVDGMLESAEDVYGSLQQAQHRPHVMDDYTIGRVKEVHTTQRNDLWLYEEQLSRWQDTTPTPAQETEIKRLQQQLDRLKGVLTACLALADELAEETIEKVLGKSDVGLAIESSPDGASSERLAYSLPAALIGKTRRSIHNPQSPIVTLRTTSSLGVISG